MHRLIRYTLLCFSLLLTVLVAQAQNPLVRYVKSSALGGTYENSGLSWENARNNLQDAINDLHNYMTQQGISEGGIIYVAGVADGSKNGTYVPTESTEQIGGGVLFTAFKLYAGISVYGGYAGTETGDALLPENRVLKYGATKPWELKYETILSGNHSNTTPTTFEWNAKKQTYSTSFPGNSYHVVWFATSGFDENGRAKALGGTALVDGFTIEGGCASNRSVDAQREHNAFGGGVYMVDGAQLKHCIVRKNEATRRGGAVYLDGGGEVDYCYLHTNQCLGLGIVAGYGGAVCVESNGKVLHSLIHNNTARIGGGACLSAEGVDNNNCFNPALAGCVVSNNTTTTEGGGVFIYKGGQMNHCTVVRNKCTGPNIIIQGRRYGRSAGVYVDRAAMIANCVMWGGEVEANSNVQYAAYTPKSTDQLKPYVNYSAISNHDLADWTATAKLEIVSLGSTNSGTNSLFPDFIAGTDGKAIDDVNAGVEIPGVGEEVSPETRWIPAGFSPLREAGVQLIDFAVNERILRSHIAADINGKTFAPRTTIGAYVSERTKYAPVRMASVEDGSEQVYTLFVDPNREVKDLMGAAHVGHSWAYPLGDINDALEWFRTYCGQEIEYYDGVDAAATVTGILPADAVLQILVKEGTCTTSGTYFSTRMRTSYLQMPDNTHLFGGYPAANTERSTAGRDPIKNMTTISANIIDNGYAFNTCHIIGFGGSSHVIVDGFRLSYAYSLPNTELNDAVGTGSQLYFTPILRDGGAILLQDKVGSYGSMKDNMVRNCVLSNCTSERGAAIYVQSSRSDVEIEVTFENCIIHNNTSTAATPSAIYIESEAGGRVDVAFNHCDILKNVGYGLLVTGNNTHVSLDNSMIWANAKQAFARSEELADNGNLSYLASILVENGGGLTGSYNLLDASAAIPTGLTETKSELTYLRTETVAGVTKEIYTYPAFINPTKNIGATSEGDLTNYGGVVNFMPRNMNPMVNAADDSSMSGADMTTQTLRSYGGAADIGAVENSDAAGEGYQPAYGRIIYVRDYGNTTDMGGDGSSWEKAINGNCTLYTNNHGFQGYDAELYAENAPLTGLQWAVDEAYYRSLKKDESNAIIYKTQSGIYVQPVGGSYTETSVQYSEVDENNRVEVWVAKGEYLRRHGFFMRDGVDVYGGFENTGNPAKGERNPKEYETIIETNTDEEIANGTFTWGRQAGYAGNDLIDFEVKEPTLYSGIRAVSASSEETSGQGPNNGRKKHAVDGDESTFWHSTWWGGYATPPHSIVLDIGSPSKLIEDVIILCEQSQNKAIKIETSNSRYYGYTTVYETTNAPSVQTLKLKVTSTTARYVRLTFGLKGDDASSSLARINEIKIGYGGKYVDPEPYYDLNSYTNAYILDRVLTQQFPYYVGSNKSDLEWRNEVALGFKNKTTWDGFVLQNGRTRVDHTRDGGAGLAIRYNGVLRNSVIRNCKNSAIYIRGGGIFCNDGTIENCTVENNVADGTKFVLGGGLYLRAGTVFNSIFTGNQVERTWNEQDGGGIYFENGIFYNNTVSDNTGHYALATGNYFNGGSLSIYNSIIIGNHCNNSETKELICDGGTTFTALISNCLFATEDKFIISGDSTTKKNLFFGDASNPYLETDIFTDYDNQDFTLREGSPAINKGTEELGNDGNGDPVTLPAYDAAYADRIQDCTVDIGAYEYNGAYSISPTEEVAEDGVTVKTASFFVTGPGKGTASAGNPDNAACMQKLQKVLDAAGRYKFTHPTVQVIVKLAAVAGGGYAPSRSSVEDLYSLERENPRTYSLMVPRGVEVWGGYTDDDFTNRDVIGHKTMLTGAYTSDGQNVNCYHVVTFTNDLFDENGEKIGAGHTTTAFEGTESPSLANVVDAQERAILDGLFIEEGEASGEIVYSGENNREKNTNRYGGAAIVTDFAHVRNCILMNNRAAFGGGALFLEDGALVSGCILENNTAEWGGAIYVKQNTEAGFDPRLWSNIRTFAHLYSCTIVKNTAGDAGGGIWFNNNVRVNSSVVWSNYGNNSANVCGQTDPYSTTAETKTSIFYPFTYSAIENLRAPGMNNISVHTEDSKGVRFDLTPADPYYYLRHYSVLARAGMEVGSYKDRHNVDNPEDFYYPTLETIDLAGNSRLTYNKDAAGNPISGEPVAKDFIEIGARAYNGPLIVQPTSSTLITRLFVAKPEDIDEEIYEAIANEGTFVEGSSFAFPMQKLDDALHYIQTARMNLGNTKVDVADLDPAAVGKEEEDATCYVRNIRFEIFVSRGTYYPYRTVSGKYDYSRGNTFLVPEGVSIYGGLRNDQAGGAASTFYTQHIADGEKPGKDVTLSFTRVDGSTETITLKHTDTETILARRELEDLNHNSIKEPWEMKYQTILSGKSVNSEAADNVYHVLTCLADEEYVGTLPDGTSEISGLVVADDQKEYTGVPIVLDGLQVMDGKAMGYDPSAVINAYSFYRGGGVLVDGNWVGGTRTATGELEPSDDNFTRARDPRSVGRRSIPLVVRNCEFTNNRAGAGGAIFSNGVVELYSCNFAQNAAKRREEADAPTDGRRSRGNGGAVFSSYVLSAVNTIFANNEAGVAEESTDLSWLDENGSRGGAVFHAANGNYGSMQIINCDFVRNRALSYPAIYVLYPNRGGLDRDENPHKVVNSIFWGNVVRPLSASQKAEGQKQIDFVTNYWDRVPVGGAPAEDPSLFIDSRRDVDGNPGLGEMLWFCAYERDKGCEPRFDERGIIDYRTANYTDLSEESPSLDKYIPTDVFTNVKYYLLAEDGSVTEQTADNTGANAYYKWVTNNIYLSSDNNALDGPNFVNPSLGPGVDNYLPSADWMVSRQNNLTDNGWTRIHQEVSPNAPSDPTSFDCAFVDDDPDRILPARAHGIYADTRKARTKSTAGKSHIMMPLGSERYMLNSIDEPLYRISLDPNPSQHQTFIDLGVYEYQHITLQPDVVGEETDVLWVSTEEKPENGNADGSSWLTPTSDLQRAIETLLASRNNHHKQINIIEGNYSPIYTIDGNMSFTINTGSLNAAATLPDEKGSTGDGDFGVLSLTFVGGWSKDVKEVHDVEAYPTVWEMAGRSGVATERMSTLLRISDAHNWYGIGSNASTVSASNFSNLHDNTQRVIPVSIDGITLQNTYGNQPPSAENSLGLGAAISYTPQYQYVLDASGKPTMGAEGEYVIATDEGGEKVLAEQPAASTPKFTLGHTIVRLNGAASTVPAVTIGEGGGYSVIHNTLFHSNEGRSLVAYNTRVVNCTFALNGDKVQLLDDAAATAQTYSDEALALHSSITNSLLWRNGAEDAWEFELPKHNRNYLAHNAIYDGPGAFQTTEATPGLIGIPAKGGGSTVDFEGRNYRLSADNADVLEGPNFVNPLLSASMTVDREQRDFHLRPSARTINQGDNDTYIERVYANRKDGVLLTEAERSAILTAETELANLPRFYNVVDRGAYEYQSDLQRVIYMDPSKMLTGSGHDWGSPFGYGNLQSAIDLAAVFFSINDQRAYVFCKGGTQLDETVTPRPGVNVYAGIDPTYIRTADTEPADDGDPKDGGYDEEDLHDYVVRVLGDRPGTVAASAQRTRIAGVRTMGVYNDYALLDGFDISPTVTDGTPVDITAPVVDLGTTDRVLPVVLRNSVIHDVRNTTVDPTDGASAAVRVRGGLLYNVLVRDCSTAADGAATTHFGPYGRAVGCTFLAQGAQNYALHTNFAASTTYGVCNTITYNPDFATASTARIGDATGLWNCNADADGYPFAHYLQPTAVGDLHPHKPSFYTSQRDLWYQLEEHSRQADHASTDFAEALYTDLLSALGITSVERPAVIDFAADRDLLGNPRLPRYAPRMDRGCFEAWNVPESVAAKATYRYSGARGSLAGGRRHPQEGSVVYVHPGAALVMDRDDFNPEGAGEGRNTPLRPGYLLLLEGGSLYGQGAMVSLPHVGVERTIDATPGAIVALPYSFDYQADARLISYDASGHVAEAEAVVGELYRYDGAERAAYDYAAVSTNSTCWHDASADGAVEACLGRYFRPATTGTYRFTAADASVDGSAPVYREGYYDGHAETAKSVLLHQYDNRPAGDIPQYTIVENMGWNLVGAPYLVADYPTSLAAGGNAFSPADYPMSLPRVVYTADAAGAFTATQSWTATPSGLSPGVAFFTQTAVIGTSEDLTFEQLDYTETLLEATRRPLLMLTNGDGASDAVELHPDALNDGTMSFHLGSDGLKWDPLATSLPSIYAGNAGGTRFALASSAPVGTDIPLGVNSGAGGWCTFALAEAEDFDSFTHIWLTDRLEGRVTDLCRDTYAVELAPEADITGRFAIRFGGVRPDGRPDTDATNYKAYGHDGRLIVANLLGGETIEVYDTAGRLLLRATARTATFEHPLPTAVYVVKVAHQVFKVKI